MDVEVLITDTHLDVSDCFNLLTHIHPFNPQNHRSEVGTTMVLTVQTRKRNPRRVLRGSKGEKLSF